MNRYYIIWIAFNLVSSSIVGAQPILDQSQPIGIWGLSARILPGYFVGQSFTAGISGTLVEIDMAFFNPINGVGILNIHAGEGFAGTLLQTLNVKVVCLGNDTLMQFMTSTPIIAGQVYTFEFIPGAGMPDPYGVREQSPGPYPRGKEIQAIGFIEQISDEFDLEFLTFVVPSLFTQPISYLNILNISTYPNPATNIITLGYDLPKASSVGITIYNVTGVRMQEIQRVQGEIGHHEELLDLGGYSEGTYFINVSACGTTERQMVQVVR